PFSISASSASDLVLRSAFLAVICSEMFFFMGVDCREPQTRGGAEARVCRWPVAAGHPTSSDLMAVIVASALAGIVAADSSSHSHLRKRMPYDPSIRADSTDWKPM